MKTWFIHLCCLFLLQHNVFAQDTIEFGAFGTIHLYQPSESAKSLVLFVSGDGGWELGVNDMAKALVSKGAMVAGIDAKHYTQVLAKSSSACYYPAGAFEELSMFLQKKYHFPVYQKPILLGFSYGATLIYGLMLQAPKGTFKAGLALGFSPDINLKKPLCNGTALKSHVLKPGKTYYLDKVNTMPEPFIVINGEKDVNCDINAVREFLKGVNNTKLVSLAKVGHGFTKKEDWMDTYLTEFDGLQNRAIKDSKLNFNKSKLPLHLLQPKTISNHLLFIISGDGGWTSFDEGIAQEFCNKGFLVVGLDAQKYFWNAKSPEQSSKDIAEILNAYIENDPKLSISLVGYSFGADVMPFIYNRFPTKLQTSVNQITLMSPDEHGDFEIHISDMLSFASRNSNYHVVEELAKIQNTKKLCLFGDDEDKKTLEKFKKSNAKIATLSGGHHYNNDFRAIQQKIQTP